MSNALLGTKFKIIAGYTSPRETAPRDRARRGGSHGGDQLGPPPSNSSAKSSRRASCGCSPNMASRKCLRPRPAALSQRLRRNAARVLPDSLRAPRIYGRPLAFPRRGAAERIAAFRKPSTGPSWTPSFSPRRCGPARHSIQFRVPNCRQLTTENLPDSRRRGDPHADVAWRRRE